MKQNLFIWSSKADTTNPDPQKYPRYEPYLMYENNWVILDTLTNEPIERSSKVNYDLCKAACDMMNDAYNQSMERQRKQVFNDTYFERR